MVDFIVFSLSMDNKMFMVVFGMELVGNIIKVLCGEKIGILVMV